MQDEVFGLGPLEPLLQDPTVSDILVNGHGDVYVERRGKIEKTVARFKDDVHLMRIIEKIVSNVGRRVDETTPLLEEADDQEVQPTLGFQRVLQLAVFHVQSIGKN